MKHPIAHFEIIGKDHDSLVKFYGDVFGWELQQMPGAPYSTTATWKPGDPGIGGGIGSADEPDRRWVTFYIAVENTDEYLKKIEEAGGKTVVETTTIPGVVTYAVFEDPEGHRVGVVNDAPPA
jgi:uncharacterized protein